MYLDLCGKSQTVISSLFFLLVKVVIVFFKGENDNNLIGKNIVKHFSTEGLSKSY